MANQRHMVPARVRTMGNSFKQMSNVLKQISAILEAQILILKGAALVTLGGSLALERFLSQVKTKIDIIQKNCDVLSQDAIQSAADWERASQSG